MSGTQTWVQFCLQQMKWKLSWIQFRWLTYRSHCRTFHFFAIKKPWVAFECYCMFWIIVYLQCEAPPNEFWIICLNVTRQYRCKHFRTHPAESHHQQCSSTGCHTVHGHFGSWAVRSPYSPHHSPGKEFFCHSPQLSSLVYWAFLVFLSSPVHFFILRMYHIFDLATPNVFAVSDLDFFLA